MLSGGSSKIYIIVYRTCFLFFVSVLYRSCTISRDAGYYVDDLHHDLPNVGNTWTAVNYSKSHSNTRYNTLPRSTARRFPSKIAQRDDSVANNFCIAWLDVRLVTWYISITIFTLNGNTIAIGDTSFRLGMTTVCCYTVRHSKCKSSASIVLLQKFIEGKATTVTVFSSPYLVHW